MKNRPEVPDSQWISDEEMDVFDAIGSAQVTQEIVADEVLVHGLLRDQALRDTQRDEQRIRDVMSAIKTIEPSQPVATKSRVPDREANTVNRKSRRVGIVSLVAALAAVFLLMISFGRQSHVSAAMVSLEKVLHAVAKPFDRTYRVHVMQEYPRDKKPRNLSQEAWDRKAESQIDGATLFVRGPSQYVLTVLLRDGLQRTSGCDGQVSWAFRENGPVHVSTDLNRFRGNVPGQQQDIPFINIHSHLLQLQSGYEVELMREQVRTIDGTILSHLVGVRKSSAIRGPKQIEIWFDAENGTVNKMLLDGLPRGQAGPKSLMLELIDQSELAPQFFSHESHHEPERRIRYDEEQP